jgi:hypothetical protein
MRGVFESAAIVILIVLTRLSEAAVVPAVSG